MFKKLLIMVSLLMLTVPSFAAYTEIDCTASDIDPVFTENSCNQCFNGTGKMQGDHIGLLSDLWMNVTEVQKIVYKEEQVVPEMINLDSSNVTWTQTPDSEIFWEYTDEFNALYSDIEGGYILDAGNSVTWLESSLSHAYKLDKNTAEAGANIGLLVYPITTHNILEDGEITIDSSEHRECVLFTSGESAPEVVEPEHLPETGPAEFMLLIIVAMILGFGVLQFRTKM